MTLLVSEKRVRKEIVCKHLKYGVCDQVFFPFQFSVWRLKNLCSKYQATTTPRAHE